MKAGKFIAEKILWESLKRWKRTTPETDRIRFLKTVPFFNELTHRQLRKVSEIVFERRYEAQEHIFEQGQPGAALFLIVEGQVAVEMHLGRTATTLAVLDRGTFFGEMALLDESPRSASARCLIPTQTLALYRADLNRLIHSDPQTACQIYQALARIVGDRLRTTNELVRRETTAEPVAA